MEDGGFLLPHSPLRGGRTGAGRSADAARPAAGRRARRPTGREMLAQTFADPDLCYPGGESSRQAVARGMAVVTASLATPDRCPFARHGEQYRGKNYSLFLARCVSRLPISQGEGCPAALPDPRMRQLPTASAAFRRRSTAPEGPDERSHGCRPKICVVSTPIRRENVFPFYPHLVEPASGLLGAVSMQPPGPVRRIDKARRCTLRALPLPLFDFSGRSRPGATGLHPAPILHDVGGRPGDDPAALRTPGHGGGTLGA